VSRYSCLSAADLIRACAESDDGAAWEEFVARFHKAIAVSIARSAYQWGKDPAQVVDDLVQETYLKLCVDKCRLLLCFAQAHSEDVVTGYIKTIAINVARDHFKSLYSQKRGGGETDQLHEDFQPAAQSRGSGGAEAMDREIFLNQVHEQLQTCAAGSNQERDCLIFWFYYLQGMTARAIAGLATIKLTAKGVEAVIFRLTRCLREHLGDASMSRSAEL
jgi:RNA polymerase sigma-70 factor, ECF subfamily